MNDIYLDLFHLHSTTTPLPYAVKANIQGIEAPSVRLDTYNNPGGDGQTTANAFLGGRLIVLEGYTQSEDITTYRQAREELAEFVTPQKDNRGRLVPRALTFTDLRGDTFTIDCVVASYQNNDTLPLHSEWQLQLRAFDHRIYSTSHQSLIVTLPISSGYRFPYRFDYSFGSSSGGFGTATNNGTLDTPPIITLSGPMQNPRLTNMTTGEVMALNLTLTSGDVVTIDMAKRTIIQGTSTNRMAAKTAESRFWMLAPGANQLALAATVFDAGFASLSWRSAYLGR